MVIILWGFSYILHSTVVYRAQPRFLGRRGLAIVENGQSTTGPSRGIVALGSSMCPLPTLSMLRPCGGLETRLSQRRAGERVLIFY